MFQDLDLASYDRIVITGIHAVGRHGVFEAELRDGQEFVTDVTLYVSSSRAVATDDLQDTVDYCQVAKLVTSVVAGPSHRLLESLTNAIVAELVRLHGVSAVTVTVAKPHADIDARVDSVSCTMRRIPQDYGIDNTVTGIAQESWAQDDGFAAGYPDEQQPVVEVQTVHPVLEQVPNGPVEVVLSLGGNQGNVRVTLVNAVGRLSHTTVIEMVDVAPLYETEPVGIPELASFLNTVVRIRTVLSPRELLALTQTIEREHGRVVAEHNNPRPLDIDIVAYGDVVAEDTELCIPHRRAAERAFVLLPWAAISPDAVLPGLGGGPIKQLARTAPDISGIHWVATDWTDLSKPLEPQTFDVNTLLA